MGLNNNDNSSERLPPTITKQRESKGLIFEEIDQDLFALEDSWSLGKLFILNNLFQSFLFSLAHCVSVDLRMGAGIAVMFREKFGVSNSLSSPLNYSDKQFFY